MPMTPIRTGLRAIHNGSNSVAKADIRVQPGETLIVSDAVADQLQRDGAFKDGPGLELVSESDTDDEVPAADAPVKPSKKLPKPKD